MRDFRFIASAVLLSGILFLAIRAHPQTASPTPDLTPAVSVRASTPALVIVSSLPLKHDKAPSGPVIRAIDDAPLGHRWLLVRDTAHPGGPGRLSLAAAQSAVSGPGIPPAAARRPVVHAGDRLIVEEDTSVATARLEAVALGAAFAGETFEVRLKAGGSRLRVVALGPGRAALEPRSPAVQPPASGVRP